MRFICPWGWRGKACAKYLPKHIANWIDVLKYPQRERPLESKRLSLGAIVFLALGLFVVGRFSQPGIRSAGATCVDGQAGQVAVEKNVLLMAVSARPRNAGNESILRVMEVSGRHGTPEIRSEMKFQNGLLAIETDGRLAVVHESKVGLHIINIQNLAAPRILSTLDWEFPVYQPGRSEYVLRHRISNLQLSEQTLLLRIRGFGIAFVDLTAPEEAKVVGSVPVEVGYLKGMAVLNDLTYVLANKLLVIDFADPRQPQELAQIDLPPTFKLGGALAIDERRQILFAAADGLHSYDISQPGKPDYIGRAKARWGLLGRRESSMFEKLYLTDSYAIVAGSSGYNANPYYFYEITNPLKSRGLKKKLFSDNLDEVTVSDERVFALRQTHRLADKGCVSEILYSKYKGTRD